MALPRQTEGFLLVTLCIRILRNMTMAGKRFSLISPRFCIWPAIIIVLLSSCFIASDMVGGACRFFFRNISTELFVANAASVNNDFLNKWPHEKSDLLPDPEVVFGRLENGFSYILMDNPRPKDRVSMHLYIQTGSMYETDGQQGLAHYLEHMLFNGTTHFKPGEIIKYFQSIGMQFGPDANAHTGFNKTVYDILLPEGGKQSLEQGLVVMKDYAEGALLLQAEIDRERRIVLAEKRTRDSVSYRTYVATMKFQFPEASISKRFPIGLTEVLKNVNHKQFKDFYDTWYRPEKMTLVMVGDFDTKVAAALIKEEFASTVARAPPKPEPELGTINHKGLKPFYHFEQEAGNTEVSIDIVEKVPREPDSLALQKKLLQAKVADQIVQNRLDAMVGKPNVPFTSASIGSGIFLHQIKYAGITAKSSPENWEKTLEHIERILRKALEYGFTNPEFQRVKKDFLCQLDNAVKKASTRSSRDLARKLMWSLNADRVFISPVQEKELFKPVINSLTIKDLHDAFRQTWAPNHRLVMVTGNSVLTNKGKDPNHQLLFVYNRSSEIKVSKQTDFKPVKFPYLPEPVKEGLIARRSKISDLGIVQIDFENGVRLNLKKTDFEANEVLVKLCFGSGRSAEPVDRSGLAALSTKVINESGLGTLEKVEIERALAGTNTTLNFGIRDDRLYFKGKTVPAEILLMFQLLYAHLIDPGFREDAYTISMERFKQRYQKLSSSIDGAMMLAGKRFLAGGDSRFGLPDYEEFKNLTLDHVRSWFNSSLKTEDIEVSIVGDIDIELAVQAAAKYLGNLPRKGCAEAPRTARLPEFPLNQSLHVPVETEIPKGLVVVAYPTEDLWDINRTRRLSILAEIISERLREQVREKLGSAYSTYAFNRPSRAYPGYGVLQIMVHVDPAEADMVVGAVKQLISDLIAGDIPQSELSRAVLPTLTSIKDTKRKNGYWLNTVLTGSEQHPQQLEWCRTITPDYASIKQEEIAAIAKQYLDNRKAAIIIVKPVKKN